MPRRHRAARERTDSLQRPERPSSDAPGWARAPGLEVRSVSSDKVYRCPGCDHEVRARTQHVVVIPPDTPERRRHWHEVCWRQELRRTRR